MPSSTVPPATAWSARESKRLPKNSGTVRTSERLR